MQCLYIYSRLSCTHWRTGIIRIGPDIPQYNYYTCMQCLYIYTVVYHVRIGGQQFYYDNYNGGNEHYFVEKQSSYNTSYNYASVRMRGNGFPQSTGFESETEELGSAAYHSIGKLCTDTHALLRSFFKNNIFGRMASVIVFVCLSVCVSV